MIKLHLFNLKLQGCHGLWSDDIFTDIEEFIASTDNKEFVDLISELTKGS